MQEIKGVQELKKLNWAKKEVDRRWALESVSRTGLVQVNQTGSGLVIKGKRRFFWSLFHIFLFLPSFQRERVCNRLIFSDCLFHSGAVACRPNRAAPTRRRTQTPLFSKQNPVLGFLFYAEVKYGLGISERVFKCPRSRIEVSKKRELYYLLLTPFYLRFVFQTFSFEMNVAGFRTAGLRPCCCGCDVRICA